jgi:hypothetical protein
VARKPKITKIVDWKKELAALAKRGDQAKLAPLRREYGAGGTEKVLFNAYLEVRQVAAIRAIAAHKHVSIASLMREGVGMMIDKHLGSGETSGSK